MAVTEETRHALYDRLDDVLGHEPATTLMEHLPPVGWSDIATRQHVDHVTALTKAEIDGARTNLQAEIDGARTNLQAQIDGLGAEMRQDSKALWTEMRQGFENVDREFEAVRTEMAQEFRAVRTEMQKGFEGFTHLFRLELSEEMRRQMRWLIGTNMGMATLLLAALKFV